MVGGGDHDGIQALHLEQCPMIREGPRLRGARGAGLVHVRPVRIAERDEIVVAELQEIAHVPDTASATADEAHLHAVVGAKDS